MNFNQKLSLHVQEQLNAYDFYHLLGLINAISGHMLAMDEPVYCIGFEVYDEITGLSELEIIDLFQQLVILCSTDVLTGKQKTLYLT